MVTLDRTCAICLEDMLGNDEIMLTVCDHAFHLKCWQNYVMSQNPPEPQNFGDNTESYIWLNLFFFNNHAGPPCPVCRRNYPTIHYLARQFATLKDSRQANRFVHMTANDILQCIEYRKK